jgi:acyl-CoA thioesterase FadM
MQPIALRFRDVDSFGHVYHAEYLSSLVLADASVTAEIVPERVGTTSLTLRETMLAADGRVVARCRAVAVLRDIEHGTSRPLSARERVRAERLVVQAS